MADLALLEWDLERQPWSTAGCTSCIQGHVLFVLGSSLLSVVPVLKIQWSQQTRDLKSTLQNTLFFFTSVQATWEWLKIRFSLIMAGRQACLSLMFKFEHHSSRSSVAKLWQHFQSNMKLTNYLSNLVWDEKWKPFFHADIVGLLEMKLATLVLWQKEIKTNPNQNKIKTKKEKQVVPSPQVCPLKKLQMPSQKDNSFLHNGKVISFVPEFPSQWKTMVYHFRKGQFQIIHTFSLMARTLVSWKQKLLR